MGKKFYAVAVGRIVGIYDTWDECKQQVHGYPKAKFKSFKKEEDAKAFVEQYKGETPSSFPPQHQQPLREEEGNVAAADAKVQQQPEQEVKEQSNTPSKSSSKSTTGIHPRQENVVGEGDEPSASKRQKRTTTSTTYAAAETISRRKKTTTTADNNNNNNNSQQQQPQPQHIWFHMNFDGGSRGNPGHAGAGAEIVTRIFSIMNDDGSKDNNNNNNNNNTTTVKRTKTKIRNYLGNYYTNNQAEYTGIVVGLEYVLQSLVLLTTTSNMPAVVAAAPLRPKSVLSKITLVVQGDSELIIKQLTGVNKCRNVKLVPLYSKVKNLLESIQQIKTIQGPADITLEHVYRNKNSNADALANEAMDAKRSWTTTDDINDDDDDWLEDSTTTTTTETKRGKVVHIT